jgi:hypothetical protein
VFARQLSGHRSLDEPRKPTAHRAAARWQGRTIPHRGLSEQNASLAGSGTDPDVAASLEARRRRQVPSSIGRVSDEREIRRAHARIFLSPAGPARGEPDRLTVRARSVAGRKARITDRCSKPGRGARTGLAIVRATDEPGPPRAGLCGRSMSCE